MSKDRRLMKICSCGKALATNQGACKHRQMGHKIEQQVKTDNFILYVKQIENMKTPLILFLATLAVTILAFGQIAEAQQIVRTTGKCTDNDNIVYTTYFTFNGQTYNVTDNQKCMSGCQIGQTENGDTCSPTRNEIPVMPFIFWAGCIGLIIWFWRKSGDNIMPTTLLLITTLAGTLIIQHVLMYIPIAIAGIIWVWGIERWLVLKDKEDNKERYLGE